MDTITFNADQVFNNFLSREGHDAGDLAFLDKGIAGSFVADDIDAYPDRLRALPDGTEVVPLAIARPQGGFTPYPKLGQKPTFKEDSLQFLSSDIQEACICVSSLSRDQGVSSVWYGRHQLRNAQFWSSTKFIPMLYVVSRANSVDPNVDIDNCEIRSRDGVWQQSFPQTLHEIVSYKPSVPNSNIKSEMLKCFAANQADLESFLRNLTGHHEAVFTGGYTSAPPFEERPKLFERSSNRRLLDGQGLDPHGSNLISAYDLCRAITTMAYHIHLPADARIPGAQWASLESIVRALGVDTARYLDAAVQTLGLKPAIRNPVIISKLGAGDSDERQQMEIVYTALFHFIDTRPRAQGKPSILRSLAMSLRGVKPRTVSRFQFQLDARMAADVTEILHRFMEGAL